MDTIPNVGWSSLTIKNWLLLHKGESVRHVPVEDKRQLLFLAFDASYMECELRGWLLLQGVSFLKGATKDELLNLVLDKLC